jgi:glycosyltransferase involved in cell wall biosynthesis
MTQITVTICTLNEEKNIKECLESIVKENPYEIILVDANSKDKTREIAKNFNVKVINVEKKGLAYQRKIAVDNVKTDYVCLLDADHRLKKDSLKMLLYELKDKRYNGIEASIEKNNIEKNYWSDCFDINFLVSHNIPRETIMIGTPCIYETKTLKKINFDPFFTGPSDDTDLCYRLTRKGYKIGVGNTIIEHKNRSSFGEFYRKMIWYGKGDAQFIFKHPQRIHRMIFHQIINYPIIKNFKALKKGYFKTIPFFILYGVIRFISMIFSLLKFLIKGTKDNNIYGT